MSFLGELLEEKDCMQLYACTVVPGQRQPHASRPFEPHLLTKTFILLKQVPLQTPMYSVVGWDPFFHFHTWDQNTEMSRTSMDAR